MADREKIELIGGPKHGLIQWVLPADRFVKIPVAIADKEEIDWTNSAMGPEIQGTKVRYDVALYMRNLMIPEFFNFIRFESENNAKLGKLDE